MTTTTRPRYLSCADTAKLIRKALKKAFPDARFSVRSDTYSGGASIRVAWIDGPTEKAVKGVTDPFASAGFDGMIDLKYYKRSWLLPDGTAAFGESSGTADSRGVHAAYEHEAPHPDAELVSFGADFIFTERKYSEPVFREALEEVGERYGLDVSEIELGTWTGPFKGTEVVSGIPWKHDVDPLPGGNTRSLSQEVRIHLSETEA